MKTKTSTSAAKLTAAGKNRSAINSANRRKRKPLSSAAREKLRQAALRNQPWRHATGPRTPEGRARSAQNGWDAAKFDASLRNIRAYTELTRQIVEQMRQLRLGATTWWF